MLSPSIRILVGYIPLVVKMASNNASINNQKIKYEHIYDVTPLLELVQKVV
jgi:hypothetical protein